MWSKSNSIVVAYVFIIAVLVGALLGGYTAGIFSSAPWRIPLEYHNLCVLEVIIILGLAAFFLGADLTPIMVTGSLATLVALTFNQDPLIKYLTLAAMLFSIGVYGMTVSRNAVRVLMSIELMLNAVNINLVAFAHFVDPGMLKGQLFAVFILAVAAAEAAVGLAIVLAIYRNTQTVDMDRFNLLKW